MVKQDLISRNQDRSYILCNLNYYYVKHYAQGNRIFLRDYSKP